MSEEMKMALFTTLLTVISGVIVYVISEYVKDFFIEPRKQFRDLVNKIDYSLIIYSRDILSPIDSSKPNDEYKLKQDRYNAISATLRELSADLATKASRLRWSRKRNDLNRKKAAAELMLISNNILTNENINIAREKNEKSISVILECLGISKGKE